MTPTATQRIATRRLKICAVICLGLLLLLIIGDFLRFYQTRRQLTSALIPESIVDRVSQQYLLHVVVSTIMFVIAVGIYLLKRYWWAILLVAITLVGDQFIY